MAGHVTVHKEAASPQAIAISGFQRALHHSRQVAYTLSTIALLLAAAIMTYGVIVRHVVVVGAAPLWQDEVCIFLLVGATFLSAASVQSHRGHVGIEAAVLPSDLNRVRRLLSDLFSFLFCAFFTWKAAALLHEVGWKGRGPLLPGRRRCGFLTCS
jgi:TRAP-type C4-dicarboxylate transport system permease small subunit